MIARAEDFGLTGTETAAQLDDNRAFYERMESLRRKSGALMGMGDVSASVTPEFGLLAPAQDGGSALTRYFMPWNCHPSLAVTGSQCLAATLLCPGTVGEGLMARPNAMPTRMLLEHPMGKLDVLMDVRSDGDSFEVVSAGLTRTARKLAAGEVFVPRQVWEGQQG